MAAGKRREDEPFEAYRQRLKNQKVVDKINAMGLRLPPPKQRTKKKDENENNDGPVLQPSSGGA